MNYLIIGGEFNNKGAEAMTFTCVQNIIKNDSESQIYLLNSGNYNPYIFKPNVKYLYTSSYFAEETLNKFSKIGLIQRIKDFIKLFVPNKKSFIFQNKSELTNILKTIDVTFDISGFKLSSKWGEEGSINYLNWILLMKKFGSKVYLMPQSFGPFNYDKDYVVKEIQQVLPLCDHIYVREGDGYKLLLENHMTNVSLSPDSVLLEKNINIKGFITNVDDLSENIKVINSHNVAIIPNYRLLDKGDYLLSDLLGLYRLIINMMLSKKYTVFLTAHAGEDLEICRKIKEEYSDCDNVVLLDHVMFSFNYESFVKKMDFIIASRYHSLVHAYKEYVPAIIIGWSIKYSDLANILNQKKYLYNICEKGIENIIEEMIENYLIERVTIKNRLLDVQKEGCYDILKK